MESKNDYFNTKEFLDILARYENSVREGREEYFETQELTDIAEYYYGVERTDELNAVLDYAIRLHPGAALPLVFRGRIALIDNKDAETARKYVEQITDCSNLDYLYLKAEIMIAEDDVTAADEFLKKQLDIIDEDEQPDYILDVATLFIDYAIADKAAEWLNMSDETTLADYRELKARIAYANGDYDLSSQLFEQLIDEDPYSGKYWNSLASTQFMDNRINDAITSSEYSIAINPDDFEAVLNKANGLFSLGNYPEALKFYERYAKLCPKEGAAQLFIGNCLLNMGKAAESLPYYEEALSKFQAQHMSTTEVLQCLAFAYSQLDRLDEAVQCIDKALAMKDGNRNALLVVKGHVLLEHRRVKDALTSFLAALDASSYSHDIFFRIAISVYDCGYPAVAYRMFKSYVDMRFDDDDNEESDEAVAYLAACCKYINRREDYLKYLRVACEKAPDELRKILGPEFPMGMEPRDYYDYEVSRDAQ